MEFGKGELTQSGHSVGKRSGRWTRFIIKDYMDDEKNLDKIEMNNFYNRVIDCLTQIEFCSPLNPKHMLDDN